MSKKDHTNLMIKILQSRSVTTIGQYCLKDHLQTSLETAKGKQGCLHEAHWVPPRPLPRFNQTLHRLLRLSLESVWHLKHCIWFPADTQEKAVCDVNIKASWRVAVPILLLSFYRHIREGLIRLWYLHVDDGAESFFQAILWDESKAIMQIPGENYTRFSWFYELHLGKSQKLSWTHVYSLSSCERGRCKQHFTESGLVSIQLFVINNIWSSGKDLI